MPVPPTFEARLASARVLSPSVRELCFERRDGAPMAFEAGQWVNLVLPLPTGELRRAYSIASRPDGTPRFELAVTHVRGGVGSSYLHELAVGSALQAVGPQGFFTRPVAGASPALFVCTGTGVTPIRSMIHDAIANGGKAPLCLLFGVRSEEEILYEPEWRELARTHPHFRFEPTLSRPKDSWTGRRGYVQMHTRELHEELAGRGAGAPHAYVCGLERMVGAVRELLRKEMGLPRTSVHSERYD